MRSVLVLLVALPSCVSARDCAPAIPYELRADAIRFALDMDMVAPNLISHEELALALGAGTPVAELDEARRRELSRWATGYADCINERVYREYP